MLRFLLAALVTAVLFLTTASGQTPLENCADQFIDSNTANAPTVGNATPGAPFATNRHLCYRAGDNSFYAIEYWPAHFAPRWAAYRLDPGNYGPDGCKTYTRDKGNCYVNAQTWQDFLTCAQKDRGDPFHTDHLLPDPKLGQDDFSNTGHDRGHIAPRQSFSWHVCGAYQTFTMANMSPQTAFLNQDIWASLEEQVLTWAVDEGPLYVVTGTIFKKFPHQKFQVYTNGTFKGAQIYSSTAAMLEVVTQHHANFAAHAKGDILKPKRDADPTKVKENVRTMRMPTGYYKVIYRPATASEPAHAMGFLLPHSFENLNHIPNVPQKEAFWSFVARIDVIEETSGTRFPGIPAAMKPVWGDSFFLSRHTGRDIRSGTCGTGAPAGVVENTTREERIAQCIPKSN